MQPSLSLPGPADSLDDIVNQNSRELQRRRRSVPHPFVSELLGSGSQEGSGAGGGGPAAGRERRMSMMDFSPTTTGDVLQMEGFQFGGLGGAAGAHGGMGDGMVGLGGDGAAAAFSGQGLMALPGQTDFATLPPDAVATMAAFNLDMGAMAAHPVSVGMYGSPGLGNEYTPASLDAVGPEFPMDMVVENQPMTAPRVGSMGGFAMGVDNDMMGAGEAFNGMAVPQDHGLMLEHAGMGPFQTTNMPPPSGARELSVPASFHQSPASITSRTMSQTSPSHAEATVSTPASTAPAPSTTAPSQPAGPAPLRDPKKDVYSKSGFDMLRALWYVATRKNATVEIGAVDMSCAFVVCDVTLNDCPIIYVSDNFQNLTGYNRHEIVGKNCRFLQSPDGKVEGGTRREFVDNDAVYKLKTAIAEGREIQQSLINYRKGGKPFLNLLTMIPIPWDTDEIRYCIGFQIDLVECPDAISGQESPSKATRGGAMQVNYKHSDIGQYIWTPPSSTHFDPQSGQTLSVDEVSALIQQFDPTRPPSEWHRESWDKMLLENADDVIHVLSLKGLFLYVSPSCKRILEYDVADLLGTPLSEICHPSDIVPVTRELKDAQMGGEGVSLAFRVRRKVSGYMWFESFGTMCLEAARGGRKVVVLVGRRRPVLGLRRGVVEANTVNPSHAVVGSFSSPNFAMSPTSGFGVGGGGSGIGDPDTFWSKMSTSGMFLHVSSAVHALLDLEPADLEGTSMQELIPRKEAKVEFGRAIEKARKGGASEGQERGRKGVVVAGCGHEVQGKGGKVMMAWTTFHPGDGGGLRGGETKFFNCPDEGCQGVGGGSWRGEGDRLGWQQDRCVYGPGDGGCPHGRRRRHIWPPPPPTTTTITTATGGF